MQKYMEKEGYEKPDDFRGLGLKYCSGREDKIYSGGCEDRPYKMYELWSLCTDSLPSNTCGRWSDQS